jgi:hypothetical protein
MFKIFLILAILNITSINSSWPCEKCRETRDYTLDILEKFVTTNIGIGVSICELILIPKACRYFVMKVGDPAIKNKFAYLRQSDSFCRDVFCYDNKTTEIKVKDFKQFLQKHYPKIDPPKRKNDDKDFKMLVLNDIHLQRKYKEGTVSDCGQVVGCCEERWGKATDGNGAGYWGTKKGSCDIPTRLFTQTIDYVKGKEFF